MIRSLALAVALVAVWHAPVWAQAKNALGAADAAAVDAAVAAQMKEQGLVGVAVGILHRGEIVYLKGYGFANLKRRTPVTTDTVFNWASNSKPVCAVAAMQLVEQGKLDLDADVRTYVPEFPDHKVKITTRQLLCHQSGLPHYDDLVVPSALLNPRTRPHSDPVFALDAFSASPLAFAPGEKSEYSSYAYILLSAVVQRAGKASFSSQVTERIARPLGLKSFDFDVAANGQANWATGYTEDDDGELVEAEEEAHAWKHGAGAFKSNIGDFARWGQALLNRKLLSEKSCAAMARAQPLRDGTATDWGLGFSVQQQEGLKLAHDGQQDEATSRLVLYPDARHGMVVLTNGSYGEPGEITTAIYAALEDDE